MSDLQPCDVCGALISDGVDASCFSCCRRHLPRKTTISDWRESDADLAEVIKDLRDDVSKYGFECINEIHAAEHLALAEEVQASRAELQHLRAALFERICDDESTTALQRMTAKDASDYLRRVSERLRSEAKD